MCRPVISPASGLLPHTNGPYVSDFAIVGPPVGRATRPPAGPTAGKPAYSLETKGRWYNINRPKDSDFDLLGSRERQRVVIRPLAGARGYRKVQSSKDVGMSG